MNFTKMEGAGNDYIYVNLFEETVANPQELAREISHRRFGVGGDGLVLIAPSQKADLSMIMYNIDGSEAEMCGNAIRCVGKYAWEHGLVSETSLKIETGAGIKSLRLSIDSTGKATAARVEMGVPVLNAAEIPSQLTGERIIEQLFDFEGFSLKGTLVSMGNPHFITFVDDVQQTPVTEWGPVIENSPLFPRRINVEFVQVLSSSAVRQRTWERGSGETWACGTGASAVCVAGRLAGKTGTTILNHLKGGELTLSWEGPEQQVIMEGPAREVFKGTWSVKTL
ncbi:MAG: diaminopimelate epimerase [SAR324 cluster bacterium]|nr:diaminopimelate epimerase [SAR324 cluster bacterium]